MRPLTQSTWGLCLRNYSLPKTRGMHGECRTRKTISSWRFPHMSIFTGLVARWTSSRGIPVSAQGRMDLVSGTVEMPRRLTKVGQIKLASDPESRRTGTCSWVPCQEMRADRTGWEVGGRGWWVAPVRIPSLTDGRCLLTDSSLTDVLSPHNTGISGCPAAVAFHPWRVWCALPAWALVLAFLRHGVVPEHEPWDSLGNDRDPEGNEMRVGRLT